MIAVLRQACSPLALTVGCGLLVPLLGMTVMPVHAADYYWDINGATPGAGGATPSGIWQAGGTTLSTDSTGASAIGAVTTTTSDRLFFSAGTDATGSYAITLTGTQNISRLFFQEGTVTLTGGTINSGGGILTIDGTGDTIGSTIAGGGVNFNGGSITLTGTNTFTGTARLGGPGLSQSTVILSAAGGNAISGNLLHMGSGGQSTTGGTVLLGADEQINDTATVTLQGGHYSGGSVFALNGFDETIGGLNLHKQGAGSGSGGTVRNGAATDSTLTLAGSGTYTTASGDRVFGRSITNGGAGRLHVVVNLTGAGHQTFSGTAPSYTGDTTVNSGTLRLWNTSVWNSNAILNGGTLNLHQTAGGTGYLAGAATRNHVRTIAGTGGTLRKTGDGTIILSGANTYLGATQIDQGILRAGSATAFGNNSAVTFANVAGATMELNNFNIAVGSLAGGGTTGGNVTLGSGTLTTGGNNTSTSYGGIISGTGPLVKTGTGTQALTGANAYTGGTTISGGTLQLGGGGTTGSILGNVANDGALAFNRSDTVTFAGLIFGSGAVNQTGGGVTVLTANNSYAGATTITNGTLIVNGDQSAATGLMSVSSGGTVGGVGTIGGSVTVANGATLSPGDVGTTPGALVIQQNLTLNSGSILDYSFGQADIAGGSLNDLTQVNGDLALDGTINVNVTPGGSFAPGLYRVISYSGILTDNGLAVGTMPTSGVVVQTSIPGQVNLVNTTGLVLNYWDGAAGPKNDSVVNGGNGIWQNSAGNDNWTTSGGTPNAPYQDDAFAIFAGTGGAVTVDNSLGQVSASGMQFAADGYHLVGGAIALTGTPATIRVGDGTAAGAGYTVTLDNVLTGSSQLVKNDIGTLVLAGANSYTGGTIVTAGTLRVSSDANLGDPGGALVLDGGTLQNTAVFTTARAVGLNAGGGTFQTDANLTLSSAVSGAGPLIKGGNATLILAADSTYNAGTTINSGTLQLGNGGTAGSVTGGIVDNGSLAVNRSDNFVLTNLISGTGSLQQTGSGTTVLTADNTYSGGTIITAGALQLGNSGATGSIAGNVLNNGALVFNRSDTYTFGGAITGSGSVQQAGIGTTVLTGDSSYSGGTTISAGVLQLGDGGASGSITGDVLNDASLVFNRSDTLNLGGVISGTGTLLQAGSGITILAGNNSYTGATTVAAGSLIINGDQSAATGAVTVQNGGTIGGNGTIGAIVSIDDGGSLAPGNVGSIPGALTIQQDLGLGSGSLLTYNFGQAGVVGGAFNDLTRVSGNLVLDGTINVATTLGASFDPGLYRVISYSGSLTDNGLAIGTIPSPTFFAQTSIPGQVNLVNTAGLTLRFWDGAAGPKNDSVVNGGDGIWQNPTGNDNWTAIAGDVNAPFTDAAFAVFAGVSGTVTVDNSLGQVAASGMQFSVDGYHLVGGAIALAGSPSSIIRVGDGTVDAPGHTATIDNVLTGSSALVKTDLGTLVLTASNSYSGGTVIRGGVLRIASDANLGAAAGGLTMDGGTLQNTAIFSTARAVTLSAGGGTFQTDADLTVSTAITGTGALTKTGAAALILTGNDSYSGGTTISAGTLQLGNGGTTGAISGDVVNNATLVFNRADTLNFSGNISGTGAVNQIGDGTTVLSGRSSYSGNTTIAAGALQAGAAGAFSPASAFAVQPGAAMDLHGFDQTVASLTNAGTVALPGAPGTTLTVTSGYTSNNGLLDLSTSLGGDNSLTDRLVVQGDTAGSTGLRITKVASLGAQTVEGIKIVDVGGASNGSFVLEGDYTLNSQPAVVAGAYGYTLQKNGISTPNDGDWYLRSSLLNGGSPPVQPLYQPGVPLYEAYGQLLLDLNRLPTLQQRAGAHYLSDGVASADRGRVWIRMEGKHSAFEPRYATADMNFHSNQMLLQAGADASVLESESGRLVAGATLRYGHDWSSVRSLYGDGSINTDVYGLSGTLTWYGADGFYADGQMQAGWFDSVLYSSLANRQMGHNRTTGYAFGAETGYRVDLAPGWTLIPQAQLTYAAADFSFTDTFDARVTLKNGNGLTGRLGVQADYQTKWDDGEGHSSEARLYGIANLYRQLLGSTQVEVSGTLLRTKGELYTGGVGGGGTYTWDDGRYGIYGEILLTSGLGEPGASYSVAGTSGLRVSF